MESIRNEDNLVRESAVWCDKIDNEQLYNLAVIPLFQLSVGNKHYYTVLRKTEY